MYEVQGTPHATKKSLAWVRSGLAGLLIGAAVTSGVFWYVLRVQEERHAAQLAMVTMAVANPAALLEKVGVGDPAGLLGNLLGNGASAPPSAAKSETSPTKDEIAAYLDGKTLPLPDKDVVHLTAGEKSQKSCVFTKEGVEAIQKGYSINDYSNGTFTTQITVLYKLMDARYAVELGLKHKPVADKTAYFGFTVITVAKQ